MRPPAVEDVPGVDVLAEYRVHAPAWEYTLRVLGDEEPSRARTVLDEMGAEGWELVAAAGETFYFKRPKGARPCPS